MHIMSLFYMWMSPCPVNGDVLHASVGQRGDSHPCLSFHCEPHYCLSTLAISPFNLHASTFTMVLEPPRTCKVATRVQWFSKKCSCFASPCRHSFDLNTELILLHGYRRCHAPIDVNYHLPTKWRKAAIYIILTSLALLVVSARDL